MDANQLSILYAAAQDQQAAVTAAIAALAEERTQLNTTLAALQNTSTGLQKAVGGAATNAVKETLAQAPKAAQDAISAATDALNNAASKVNSAGAWISWKFALVFALAGAAAVATNYAIGRFTLPDRAEIEALRSEKAELEANIADLTKRGGRIKLSNCGPTNRLCVQITAKQGSAPGQDDYQGAWVSEDNKKRFAIPLGY